MFDTLDRMGRHSAPDDSDEEVATAGIALAPDPGLAAVIEARGRHARGDESAPNTDFEHTQRIAAVVDEPNDSELTLNLGTLIAPTQVEPAPEPAALPGTEAASDNKAARVQRKAARKTERKARESDTKADLRMLRQQPAVRAQVIGAVLASFLVYTLVMIVLGTASYVLWLWIPIVASGVLVGLVLDLAHRRAAKRADQPGR